MGKFNLAQARSIHSYLDSNKIGGLGSKYIARSSFSRIEMLSLSKSIGNKASIILEVRECSISPRPHGVCFSIYT
jgi:hypothetical protein